MQESSKIKMYMHNFAGFDSHLILSKYNDSSRPIHAINLNSEKVKAISVGIYWLIDSYSFQSSSLSKLTTTLSNKKKKRKKILFIRASRISYMD